MRILIWGKIFVKSFRRFSKKHPDLIRDAERTLKLLVENSFALQLETHKLKGKSTNSRVNYLVHGLVKWGMTYVSYLTS